MNTTEHNSFIHNLQIASPCKMDWDKMTGDERKRFCGACKLNVYNISSMTLPEAEELIIGSEGRVCVRLYRRPDGTVITQDCPVGLAARVKRKVLRSLALTATAMSVLVTWAVNYRWNSGPTLLEQWRSAAQPQLIMGGASAAPPGRMTMGEVAMPIKPAASPSPLHKQPKRLTR